MTPQHPLTAVLTRDVQFDPDTVTPGVVGFIVTFMVAAIVVLLMLDMTRRIRRTRYRIEIAERLDAEQSAADQFAAERFGGEQAGYRSTGRADAATDDPARVIRRSDDDRG